MLIQEHMLGQKDKSLVLPYISLLGLCHLSEECFRMKGMKTLTKLMEKKLDQLPTSEWSKAVGLWMELEKILKSQKQNYR